MFEEDCSMTRMKERKQNGRTSKLVPSGQLEPLGMGIFGGMGSAIPMAIKDATEARNPREERIQKDEWFNKYLQGPTATQEPERRVKIYDGGSYRATRKPR